MSLSVSVLIPTYNYAERIIEAIKSVLNQRYPSSLIEIIVVDDGSTDNTQEVLNELVDNKSIKYFYQSNQGKASATIKAIKESTGDIIFCLDADDSFLPDKIQKTVEIFEQNSSVVHVSTPALIRYKNQKSIKENIPEFLKNRSTNGKVALEYFFSNNMLFGGGSTYACLAKVLKQANIPPQVNMYIDELLVIIALTTGNTYFIAEPLSVWNIHEQNYSVYGRKDDNRIEKNRSLLVSSSAILTYLSKDKIDNKLTKLYSLKHQIRIIHFAEIENTKTGRVIYKFIVNCFIHFHYSISVYIKYNVFKRLLPTRVIRLLKSSKKIIS